jgi:hypothetical protein
MFLGAGRGRLELRKKEKRVEEKRNGRKAGKDLKNIEVKD